MTDYTVGEIEDAVNDWQGWEGFTYTWQSCAANLLLRGESVEVKQVAGKLPEEGGGESVDIVIAVGTQYFQKHGYYASHYGTDWDGSCHEVKPVERMVTFYE